MKDLDSPATLVSPRRGHAKAGAAQQAPAALFPLTTVNCFACPHAISEVSAIRAHDAMEAHYAEKHRQFIRRLGY
jgi:hypothetical protein